jgi:CRISPR system Cascade subunit CasC
MKEEKIMNRAIVDIHVLQTVPPSNINRDDTGSPKTAIYGGTLRARVSSQAWKRAIRKMFEDRFDAQDLGVRTKRLIETVAAEIIAIDSSKVESAEQLAAEVLKAADVSLKKSKNSDKEEAEALFFIGKGQARTLAELALSGSVDKKIAKEALQGNNAVDVALFGRMVASAPELNMDASAQVAHAISVHEIENEYDYFTAVDDMALDDNAGAGMIGTVEYNSSTLYRFATVSADALNEQIGSVEATGKAVSEFVRAFLLSMPKGKQNTFANATLPSAVLVAVRNDQSVNLVGAFEDAVKAAGAMRTASEELAKYAHGLYEAYSGAPKKTFVLAFGNVSEEFFKLGEKTTLDSLTAFINDEVIASLSEV